MSATRGRETLGSGQAGGAVTASGGSEAATGVLVIGAGPAGLCAAIEARLAGAAVLLADAAPVALLGGNARHCRNLRLANAAETPWQRDSYPVEAYLSDLRRMGTPDAALAQALAEGSATLGPWLAAQGVAFEPWAPGNLPFSRRTVFLRGGGQAMVNALLRRAAALGVAIRPGWQVGALDPALLAADGPLSVAVQTPEGPVTVTAQAVVLACGGYGADRSRIGPGVANRGTPFQRGEPLLSLLGPAAQAGQPGDGHLVPVDARAAEDDAGIVSRLDGMPFGLVVGPDGCRLADEGATPGPQRFSFWARVLQAQADPRGWIVLPASGAARLPPLLFPPLTAATPQALAAQCGIDPVGLEASVRAVAAHLAGGPPPDPPRSRSDLAPLGALDGPWSAIPMRLGMAFTRHGLAVDASARVLRADGSPAPGLFAAGTAMCGAVLGQGYLSGAGLAIAGVFGRIAGQEAAARAGRAEATAQPLPLRPPAEAPPGDARRALNICNTCGFCTGLCDVFPAAQLRQGLAEGDIRHLAHLCHDCRSCHYDCQYAPPHDLAVNLPAALAEVRARDYAAGLPLGALVGLFALCLLGVPLAVLLAVPWDMLFAAHTGPGAFYRVIPHPVMAGGAALAFGAAVALLALRLAWFWRAGAGPGAHHGLRPWLRALHDAATLRNLKGCEDRSGPAGALRRRAHHLVAYGFGLTFAATLAGAALHHLAGRIAPYPLASAPVLLGGLGGLAMLAGLAVLEARRRRADRAPSSPRMEAEDRFARAQLAILAATGLAVLAFRDGPAMGLLLALHLGAVLGFALVLPFGKLSHGAYRLAALARNAAERAAPRLDKPANPDT